MEQKIKKKGLMALDEMNFWVDKKKRNWLKMEFTSSYSEIIVIKTLNSDWYK